MNVHTLDSIIVVCGIVTVGWYTRADFSELRRLQDEFQKELRRSAWSAACDPNRSTVTIQIDRSSFETIVSVAEKTNSTPDTVFINFMAVGAAVLQSRPAVYDEIYQEIRTGKLPSKEVA